ncbi:HAD-IC family P-type ATPase [Hujiaoplasma nucleasis]|uniref:HAD-IC family P-type ATPase n=1 Tax=Hujiaoplasma nucleasis TaxID=2725268 RepID=A0A7L6N3A4_9MOLU|nr:HAD-IC family P-type ATPase [Hujiaoplasma nucleasis]QLY39698.1 HAD-IC family P-type ATPase [Hujiaoplasma nucleasis]
MTKIKNIPFGLTLEEVNLRKSQNQVNVSSQSNLKTPWKIIRSNLFTYFNMLLAIIAALLVSIGSFKNLWFIVIALINTLIGIIQEFKARSTIQKLSLISDSKVKVIRQGIELEINVEDVVLDDVYKLEAGRQIIADSLVIEGAITVNEANLTGESDSIAKEVNDHLLSGSFVVSGEAYVRATAVGKDNYIETLQTKVKTLSKPKSVILNSLRGLLKIIGIIILPLGLMTFYNAFLRSSYDYLPDFIQNSALYQEALISMAGSMVAMVPSGLFLLTTMTFATSVIKLAKHHTLVQELYSIETLARIDTLCLDKTGTITDGTMSVDFLEMIENPIYTIEDYTEKEIKNIISTMNYALNDQNQTSQALRDYFGEKKKYNVVQSLDFDSMNKYSVVEFEGGIYVLGAPEMILLKQYSKIKKQVERYAAQGKRVLLLAESERLKEEKINGKIRPIALIILNDNIRDSAIKTINDFNESKITVKVISGDNAMTVSEVARRAGVLNADKYISLDGVPDEELVNIANDYNIFGRVTPNQKKLLITHMQDKDHKVCMVGDGVNDILALKQADTSVSLASGTDASRNISHFVLMDNNFATIPKVIKEGRQIVSNMEKASVLYLVKTLYTIILTFILLMTDNIYPFQPIQLVVIETFIIGVPSFFIALESNNQQFKGNFLVNVFKNVLPGALIIIGNLLGVYIFASFFQFETNGNINQMISTVGIIAATFAYWLVLVNVTTPLNKLRTLVIALSFITSALSFIIFNDILGLYPLDTSSVLLMLLLMETTYISFSIYRRSLIKFWP